MVHKIKTVTEFDSFLKDHEDVLVDVYAEWCGPCKMLAPIIEQVSSERPKISFCKVDIDLVEEVQQRYDVLSVPTLLFIRNGQVIKEQIGYLPASDILKLIDTTF